MDEDNLAELVEADSGLASTGAVRAMISTGEAGRHAPVTPAGAAVCDMHEEGDEEGDIPLAELEDEVRNRLVSRLGNTPASGAIGSLTGTGGRGSENGAGRGPGSTGSVLAAGVTRMTGDENNNKDEGGVESSGGVADPVASAGRSRTGRGRGCGGGNATTRKKLKSKRRKNRSHLIEMVDMASW